MSGTTTALDVVERGELERHEQTIEKGMQTFVNVGRSLAAIREHKLYREQYKTFEQYCQARWGFKKSRAYELIESASVVENVRNSGQIEPPETASHAEALAELPEDEQGEAWQEAVESAPGGKVTAEHVRQTVKKRKEGQQTDTESTTQTEVVDTDTGEVIENAEVVETQQSTRRTQVNSGPSEAMRLAGEALNALEKIDDYDPDRDHALDTVSQWIEDNR